MTEFIRPARVVPPGKIILRELNARGWTQQDLAAIMGRPVQVISEIVRAKKQITAETAHQLGKAFGTSADLWLNLESNYQLDQSKSKFTDSEIERRSHLYNLAPINEMIRRGWIRDVQTAEELEEEFCRYFKIQSIAQQPQIAYRLRVSQERGPEERAIITWIRRVEQLAGYQPVEAFSPKQLSDLVDQLIFLMEDKNKIEQVPALLLQYGIHFVIVPHLPKSFLDGAAIWINDHPVIALSLRYDRIDAFWFTLFHELSHIYLGHQQPQVDQLYGLDDPDPEENEVSANKQASQWLLPEEALNKFIEMVQPRFSSIKVEEFAKAQKRHPGIVVGQLMYRGEIKYSQMRSYLVKVKPYLNQWMDVPFPKN